jgi:hypothetical protein
LSQVWVAVVLGNGSTAVASRPALS